MQIYYVLEKSIALTKKMQQFKLQCAARQMKTAETKYINKNNNPIEVDKFRSYSVSILEMI